MAAREFTRKSILAATASTLAAMAGASVIVHGSFGVFLVPLTKEFGWGRAEISIALTAWSWTQASLMPFSGRLMDRYGVRAVVLPGLLLLAATLFALAAQNGSLILFYAIFALTGVCSAMGGPVANTKLFTGWFHRHRGLVFSLGALAAGTTGSLLPQWVHLAEADLGWRSAYVTIGVYVLIMSILPFLFLREAPSVLAARRRQAQTHQPEDASGMIVSTILRKLPFYLCATISALNTIFVAINLHLVALLTDRGLSSEAAVTVLSAEVIGSTVAYLIVGYLLDRINNPKFGMGFAALGLAGILLLHHGSGFPVMLAAGVLIGVGLTGDSTMIPYFFTRFFGLRAFASVYGLNWAVAAVANGIQPVILGASFDSTGSYSWSLLYAEICVVVVVLCFLFMPRYRYDVHMSEPEAGEGDVFAPDGNEAKV